MNEVSDCLLDAFDKWSMSRDRISHSKNGMVGYTRRLGLDKISTRKEGFVSGSLNLKNDNKIEIVLGFILFGRLLSCEPMILPPGHNYCYWWKNSIQASDLLK